MEISYYSEIDLDYTKAVMECDTLAKLKKIVKQYRDVAGDAVAVVKEMDEKGFKEFCIGRKKKEPSFAWMKKYGPVILPKIVLIVGITAAKFHVPWGCAYHRLKDLGKLPTLEK